ncbi:MAG TPA: hypothetical protein PKD45_12620, partial [Flavobacteriales bacterium]|nr:hypothetical protein [Flavobacteriales bacterium]
MADLPQRRSIRLKGYDYTRVGAYFVTICTQDRKPLFGKVVDGKMVPSAIGEIVQRCWDAIPDHMPMAICDAFVVMPDHVHGIIVIRDVAADRSEVTGGEFAAPTDPSEPPPIQKFNQSRPPIAIMEKDSLGHIVQTFKAAVSRQAIRDGLMPRGIPIWQRNYYEHIIRNVSIRRTTSCEVFRRRLGL